jgi:glucan 1,3-beta-glucosidase
MSGKRTYYKGLSGINFSGMSRVDLDALFLNIFEKGIHGISFSAYEEGQGPGTQLEAAQIRRRMAVLQPHVKWVRSFSCTDGNELIPEIAHEFGIKTLVGAWLGNDADKNEEEIEGLIAVAQKGCADMLAVGNEVMLRGDLPESKVLEYIQRVKEAAPGIPVGYVDAYYLFEAHPAISEACDVILANCYPFWEGFPAEHAFVYFKQMAALAQRMANGKPVIISETGWPNRGSAERAALPSYENALKYFINIYTWSEDEGIPVFYFSSFDETWKIEAEGDVGAYWGIWDKDGNLKYGNAEK